MDEIRTKRGHAHGNVFGPFRTGRAVLNTATLGDHKRFPGAGNQRFIADTSVQFPSKDDAELIEFGSLRGLGPT